MENPHEEFARETLGLEYGVNFTDSELEAHYEALVGCPAGLTRTQLISALRGTDFDEHAYL
jgi:hypothetical protein